MMEFPEHVPRGCPYCDKHTTHLKVRIGHVVVYLCEPCLQAGVYANPEPEVQYLPKEK